MFLGASRKHWSIENECHWVLDVAFCEDDHRLREGHAPENMSVVREMALAMLKKATAKIGIKTSGSKPAGTRRSSNTSYAISSTSECNYPAREVDSAGASSGSRHKAGGSASAAARRMVRVARGHVGPGHRGSIMNSFLVRIQLHHTSDYDTLHQQMESRGFNRTIRLGDRRLYHLPWGEYLVTGISDADAVIALAEAATSATGYTGMILVTVAREFFSWGRHPVD